MREVVVFLINGIPVLVIECKNANKDVAIALRLDQIRRYHRETPEFFVSQQLFTATDAIGFSYGVSWNTVRRNIVNWKDEEVCKLEARVQNHWVEVSPAYDHGLVQQPHSPQLPGWRKNRYSLLYCLATPGRVGCGRQLARLTLPSFPLSGKRRRICMTPSAIKRPSSRLASYSSDRRETWRGGWLCKRSVLIFDRRERRAETSGLAAGEGKPLPVCVCNRASRSGLHDLPRAAYVRQRLKVNPSEWREGVLYT